MPTPVGLARRIWNPTHAVVRRLAYATLVANTVIVLTGGAVRLTGSGLGCPTWPRCTDESFVPHGELGIHGVIEFGNRLLTYVLVAVVVATWVAVWRLPTQRRQRRLVTVLALGIPAQAVIGGVTVLTDLNPWVVALHLLVSMGLISGSVLLIHRLSAPESPTACTDPIGSALLWLVRLTYAAVWVVLYLGTVVTGSGPHAGDLGSPRNGLDPATWSQVHAAAAYLLLGLTVACLVLARRTGAPATMRRSAGLLLGVELSQGVVGFVQYATDLPALLVGLHLLGAALLVAAATDLLVRSHDRTSTGPAAGVTADLSRSKR